jgi:hypothetical protein
MPRITEVKEKEMKQSFIYALLFMFSVVMLFLLKYHHVSDIYLTVVNSTMLGWSAAKLVIHNFTE